MFINGVKMLRAIDQESGLSIQADDINISDLISWAKKKFICPLTQAELSFVRPHERAIASGKTNVNAYFKHKNRAEIPDHILYDGDLFHKKEQKYYLRESLDHQIAKQSIKKHCADVYYSYHSEKKVSIQFEYVVKLSTGKWRIADVAVIYPCGIVDAHEAQLCKISPEELEERTDDYLSEGINAVWYFGKSANTDANNEWFYNRFGWVAPELKFGSSEDMSYWI